MDYELTLFDRINIIKETINKYGENNFYISFSGGKDSVVLHYLIDQALPNNHIPRVFINTGIEYIDIVKFVKDLADKDNRFVIINSSKPIKTILETYGYPFKSKQHSHNLNIYQHSGKTKTVEKYLGEGNKSIFLCPKLLKYQFSDNFKIKISDRCCYKLKKEPIKKWMKENNKTITITGMRKEEGGNRNNLTCAVFNSEDLVKFHPLAPIDNEWEEEYIKCNNIKLCSLYYPPFNFKRTGCKGCPFSLDLQKQLTTMKKYLPNERKQCEFIWKPVYEEYRKLNYRLDNVEQLKLF